MAEPLSFTKAYEKWQLKLGIFLTTFLNWSLSESLVVVMLGTILYILLVPVGGYMADRFGEKKVMLTGAIATLILLCFFYLKRIRFP
jgi:MFS family permease